MSKDKAPQSCENLQMFVWWGRGKFVPPNIQMSVKFSDFEEPYLCQCSTNHFQTDCFLSSAAKDDKDRHGL